MVLSGESIRAAGIIVPHEPRTEHSTGLTFGESFAGYDIRLGADVCLKGKALGVSFELFRMPRDVLGRVCDKSSWARHFVFVQNTVIEPGWFGYLTLELTSESSRRLIIPAGTPIAQVVFERVDSVCVGYTGAYHLQPPVPTASKLDITQFIEETLR